jgi:hypothetical protein
MPTITVERRVCEALVRLYYGKSPSLAQRKDFMGRQLVCTPYEGRYGVAGWVVCASTDRHRAVRC